MGIILECTLGYGFSNASNLCQRFANGVMDAISEQMHAADADFFDSNDRTPAERALVARRRKLSAVTGRNECALFSLKMYTDDGIFIVAGAQRALRLLRLWGTFVKRSNARMAIPAKRTLGAGLVWCGVSIVPCLGMVWVPRAKTVRACAELTKVARADGSMQWGDYRSLVGLLEHLRPIVGFTRRQLHELYFPHRVFADANPTTRLSTHITSGMKSRASEWLSRLATSPGALADAVFGTNTTAVPTNAVFWYIFGDAARERAVSDSGLGGYMHGFAWRAPLQQSDVAGPCKLPITVLEYMVIAINLMVFSPLIPVSPLNWPLISSDSLGSFLAILDLRSKSPLIQFVTNFIADMPEVGRFWRRLAVAHVYGSGNAFADAESRGDDERVGRLVQQLGVTYERVALPKRARRFMDMVRTRARQLVRGAADPSSSRRKGHQARGSERARKRQRGLKSDKSAPARDVNAFGNGVRIGEAPNPGPADGMSPPSFRPANAAPRSPPRPRLLAPAQSPVATSPVPVPRPSLSTARLCLPPAEESPGPSARRQPAAAEPAAAARAPTARSSPPKGKAPARRPTSAAANRRDMADFDPTMAPTFMALKNELEADTSPFRIGLIDESLVAGVFQTYADSAATRTIGSDRSAWRKWKAFCARHHIERLWRNDMASNSGADAQGHRREVFILRAFLIETHREMKPRRSRNTAARPRSALNVVAGVRRIHKRAMIDMVDCTHLAMALRGLNAQFIREEGSNAALLEERKEPLNNEECAALLAVPSGTICRRFTVNWDSTEMKSFKAGLLTGRQSGMRKADLASLDEVKEAHEMSRDNLTWYLDVVSVGWSRRISACARAAAESRARRQRMRLFAASGVQGGPNSATLRQPARVPTGDPQ